MKGGRRTKRFGGVGARVGSPECPFGFSAGQKSISGPGRISVGSGEFQWVLGERWIEIRSLKRKNGAKTIFFVRNLSRTLRSHSPVKKVRFSADLVL